jgi:hypothetical protein
MSNLQTRQLNELPKSQSSDSNREYTILSIDRPKPAKMDNDRSIPRISERRGGPLLCGPLICGSCQPNPSSIGTCSRFSSFKSYGSCTCGTTNWAETKCTIDRANSAMDEVVDMSCIIRFDSNHQRSDETTLSFDDVDGQRRNDGSTFKIKDI